MDRLTAVRCNGIKQGYWSSAKKEDVVQRLGEYEDTGLTPEEIKTWDSIGGYSVDPWISTKDRKPPLYERVLIARVYEAGAPLKVEQATLLPDGWWKVFGTNCKRVDYWMPMPKAPAAPETR